MTKSTKKKLIAIGICFVILVASILSNTIAYFTDDEEVSNTFTSGNVKITLDEGKATLDTLKRVTVDTNVRVSENQDYGTLYPAQQFAKDPTITNKSTEAAYIAAKVTVTDGDGNLRADGVIPDNNGGINIKGLLSGGLLDTATFVTSADDIEGALATNDVIYQAVENGDYVFYFFVKTPVVADDASTDSVDESGKVILFEQMKIPNKWNNAEMAQLKELDIKVTAYGVQTFGFANTYKALTATFFDNLLPTP